MIEAIRTKKDLLTWIYQNMTDESEFKSIIPSGSRDLIVTTTKGKFRVRVSSA